MLDKRYKLSNFGQVQNEGTSAKLEGFIWRLLDLKGPASASYNKQFIFGDSAFSKYRKIPLINLGLIFVQKVFFVGLFSREHIIGENFAF